MKTAVFFWKVGKRLNALRLSNKTLEKLREVINGDGTEHYRKGNELVSFFNQFGFHDRYGQGFPSRWRYTDERLQRINGTPELDKCIRAAFAVIDYVGHIDELDSLISDFNQYMAFDKWAVVRDNNQITFKKLDKVVVCREKQLSNMEPDDFLKLVFDINVDALMLDINVTDIVKARISEVDICVRNNAPLSAIFLIGSILEGILLGVATAYPQVFNQAQCAPKDKDSGKTRRFPEWTLNNFIEVAAEIGVLKQDVKKFSHVVRDFRNYIHPYQQMASHFSPDKETALICFQVLKAAICQISDYRAKNPIT